MNFANFATAHLNMSGMGEETALCQGWVRERLMNLGQGRDANSECISLHQQRVEWRLRRGLLLLLRSFLQVVLLWRLLMMPLPCTGLS